MKAAGGRMLRRAKMTDPVCPGCSGEGTTSEWDEEAWEYDFTTCTECNGSGAEEEIEDDRT